MAAPTSSSEFSISGSTVTVSSAANNPNTAFFIDPSPNAYTFNIQSGANIGNNSDAFHNGNLIVFDNGTVNNSGTLSAANYAIWIHPSASGTTGTVNNFGSITASESGIYIGGNGTVNNQAGGTISGTYPVYISGQGTVNNANGATISSSNTYSVFLGSGTVNNSGTISSTSSYGVKISGSGTVNNSTTGLIYGAVDGVWLKSGGQVTNAGSITSNTGAAVYIKGTGNLINSGTITSNSASGAYINGSATVVNSGTISSSSSYGLYINGIGIVTNTATGVISAGATSSDSGLYINGNGTVINAGSISGNYAGIHITGTGTVTNTGTITSSGYYAGVQIEGVGTVNNFGTISSTYGNGVTIHNNGTVFNSGTISAYYNNNNFSNNKISGVLITGTGMVTNTNTGSIYGGASTQSAYGVWINGTGTVHNSGTISAYSNNGNYSTAVQIDGSGGTIYNDASGSLTATGNSASAYGIYMSSSGATVVNRGTISGTSNSGSGYGVYFNGSNSTLTSMGGTITGTTDSVYLNGQNDQVNVIGRTDFQGTIEGANGTGNTLTMKLVGMTPAEAAAANAASGHGTDTITVGGYTYDWADFQNVTVTAVSLETVVDSGLKDVATKIDYITLPKSLDAFYASAANDPEKAVNLLVGREFDDAFATIGLSDATALAELADGRAFDLRMGAGGFDLSGLNVTSSSMIASLGATENTLSHLMGYASSGTLMSDSKEMVITPSSESQWAAWASGTVTLADQSDTATAQGFNATTGSPTIGADFRIDHNLAIGALMNYSTTGANFGDGSHMDVQTGLLGVYGTWADGPWFINGLVGGGYNSYDNERHALDGSVAKSHPDGNQVVTTISGGHDFRIHAGLRVTPEVGVQYTHLTENSFTEGGAGAFDLAKGEQDVDSFRTRLGFRVTDNFEWNGIKFTPEIHATWYHECLDDSHGVTSSLEGAPLVGSFVVQSNSMGRDFAMVGAGISLIPDIFSRALTLFVNYDAQVGQSDFIAHTFNGGVRYDF